MPKRVVSLNLCTDILALSLTEPSQLISVSHIAADPVSSPVAEAAKNYHLNRSGLEEILSLKPDLVLASVYTAPHILAALEQAGIAVERFGYAQNFADIAQQITQMGQALGQQQKAEMQIGEINRTIGAAKKTAQPVTALLYEPNGYTSGAGTLADEIMKQLGIINLAARDSRLAAGRVTLEDLIRLKPDMIIEPEFYEKPALAYQNYRHPVMQALVSEQGRKTQHVAVPGRYWSCGSIYTLEAVRILQRARQESGE
ncbi:ABC transporter substrate-binding protein [Pseudochrobactrum asaccharolyticum]|uniref:Iron complex transport system substrate-binding protein n=1 Tax=Pseudochrobactrum asaccharolyticum TaxID=354351 RepID=A0A366E732_9HYPH|nr:ABC transporter substrate-binding protein [Pseudochrobactrum asaccharolyticum]RBO97599.1 iron complex transport system substrate-binding protein [Pseudochrobactrum asaccharolyticum]